MALFARHGCRPRFDQWRLRVSSTERAPRSPHRIAQGRPAVWGRAP